MALLPDTIEDTDETANYLREQAFPEETIEGVLSVTKREGESYDEFVRRAAKNPIGKKSENSRPGGQYGHPPAKRNHRNRCRTAAKVPAGMAVSEQ